MNYQLGWQIFHWRSRDGEEVDFLIRKDPNSFLFVEAKVTASSPKDPSSMPEVKRIFAKKIPPLIVCHQEGEHILGPKVPIALLKNFLMG